MKRTLILLLSFLAVQAVLIAEPPQDKDVVITISAERDVILPYEPLGIAVILKNNSGEVVEKTGVQWTSFRIKKGESGDWFSYMGCGYHASLPPPRKFKLLPGQSFEDTIMIHVGWINKPVFNNPGVYYIQVGTPFGESEAIRIMVNLPETSVDAVEAISNKKLFMLFDDYTAACYLRGFLGENRNIDDIAKDLDNFKKASGSELYSSWIIFSEFILKKEKIDRQDAAKKHMFFDRLIAEYKPVVGKLPSPQKESLLMAMASVQMDLNKKNEALELLQEIISTHADGYFRNSAQYRQEMYEKR